MAVWHCCRRQRVRAGAWGATRDLLLTSAARPAPLWHPLPRSWGLILYRARLPAKALEKDAALDLGAPPHDYAVRLAYAATAACMHAWGPAGLRTQEGCDRRFKVQAPCLAASRRSAHACTQPAPLCCHRSLQSVFVDGELAGRLDRSQPAANLTLPARRAGALALVLAPGWGGVLVPACTAAVGGSAACQPVPAPLARSRLEQSMPLRLLAMWRRGQREGRPDPA